MNKSKITAYTALATIMSASVAYADLSLSGFHKGKLSTGDNTSGVSNTFTTSSVYVTYGSTLDNGMGLSAGFSITGASMGFSTAIDTGMGTLGFGTVHNSAVDGMDSMPAGANSLSSNQTLGGYSDGDTDEGNGIKYTSPSMNGWTLAYSMGETVANGDRNSSVAVKGSVAGLSLAAGAVDDNDGSDDNFFTVGYSVAGVDMGYGMYDDDAGSEATVIGLSTSMAGLSLGYTYEENDASTDTDLSRYSVGKDLGGMALTLFFTDTDDGTAADNQQWTLTYAIGF
jgi:hypothetical protein|tara:strand:+ start:3299 stop:4150 length:852 start_codon:yes stop_codon:yes gene_type:complete